MKINSNDITIRCNILFKKRINEKLIAKYNINTNEILFFEILTIKVIEVLSWINSSVDRHCFHSWDNYIVLIVLIILARVIRWSNDSFLSSLIRILFNF